MRQHIGGIGLALIVLVGMGAPPGRAAESPSYSGMVRIADNTFLTVHDRKTPLDKGYRLGILTVTEHDGTFFRPLPVKDWREDEGMPSDLEACCAIPGRSSEYLLAESGSFNRKFGRIFHVQVKRDQEGAWQAAVLRVFRCYRRQLDEKGRTHEGEQVEGIACFTDKDKTILVLGERGGQVRGEHRPGRLVWGELDFERAEFKPLGDEPLVAKSVLGDRDCSDLLLVKEKEAWTVLSVATRDGGSAGPFHSAVFRAGTFQPATETTPARFVREETPVVLYQLHGLKVEALGLAPLCILNSVFSIATDDEAFGGIWRPLFR
jgi:hypothetical protein